MKNLFVLALAIILFATNAVAQLTVTVDHLNESCLGNDGKAWAMVQGGSLPYIYTWSVGSTFTSDTLFNLSAGTYSLTVTDANNLTGFATVEIADTIQYELQILPINCQMPPAQISLRAKHDYTSGTYGYAWFGDYTAQNPPNGGRGTLGIANASGMYSFTITNFSTGCQETTILNIQPSTGLPVSITTSTANNCSLPCAMGPSSPNNAPYTYVWSNGSTAQQICNLTNGTYTLTVTDTSGCSGVDSVVINSSTSPISVSIQTVDINCSEAGSLKAIPLGGTAPYMFSWSNGEIADSVATFMPGTYIVTITDANGCSVSQSATCNLSYTNYPSLFIQKSANCTGTSCLEATVQGSGTYPFNTYTYVWSNAVTTSQACGLSNGTYTVTVTTFSGCTLTGTETVNNIVLTATASATPAACSNNGTATVTAVGGNPPYTYLWSNNATTATITNLLGGTYSVTVIDGNGCSVTSTTTVTSSAFSIDSIIQSPASCPSAADGSLAIYVSGNNPPFTFDWGAGATTINALNGIAVGSYTVTIADGGGCSTTATTIITSGSVSIDSIITINATCPTAFNGSATVFASGTDMPFQYDWGNGPSTINTINQLAPGTYTVTTTNSAGCTAVQSVLIDTIGLQISIIPTSNAGCDDMSGSAQVTVFNGTAPYTTSWGTSTSTNLTATSLSKGTYVILVTDSNQCQASGTVSIAPPVTCQTLLRGIVYSDNDGNCNFNSGDVGLSGKMVSISPGYYVLTDSDGQWYQYVQQGNTYTLKVIENNQNISLTPSCGTDSLTVQVNDSVPILAMNFTYTPTFDADVSTSFTCVNSRAGFDNNIYLYISNNGTNATDVAGSFVLDPAFTNLAIIGSNNGFIIDSISSNPKAIHYRYYNLPPQQQRYLHLSNTLAPIPNVSLNQTLYSSAYISPINQVDVIPSNNTYNCESWVVASYDPNDKQVRSEGVSVDGAASPTDTLLNYYIRFQNTGNDTAFNITVIDTLDAYLDVSSFRLLSTSHNVAVEFYDEHIVHFVFNNIMLPDSNVNEPMSHGFIEFEIEILDKTELNPVSNQAAIYFDFNPAIFTNTVTTLRQIVGIAETPLVPVNVFPNPTSGLLSVNLAGLPIEQVVLYDMMGRVAFSQNYQSVLQAEIDASVLAVGMYMVRIRNGVDWYSDKVVKTE